MMWQEVKPHQQGCGSNRRENGWSQKGASEEGTGAASRWRPPRKHILVSSQPKWFLSPCQPRGAGRRGVCSPLLPSFCLESDCSLEQLNVSENTAESRSEFPAEVNRQ